MLHRRDLLKISALGGVAALAKMPATLAQTPAAKPRTRIVFLGTRAARASRWAAPIPPT